MNIAMRRFDRFSVIAQRNKPILPIMLFGPIPLWSVGPYWISIYDKNKNKLIGSIRIVKQ